MIKQDSIIVGCTTYLQVNQLTKMCIDTWFLSNKRDMWVQTFPRNWVLLWSKDCMIPELGIFEHVCSKKSLLGEACDLGIRINYSWLVSWIA